MWVPFWSARCTDIDIARQMQTFDARRCACSHTGTHIGTHARTHQHHYTHRDIKMTCTVSPPSEDECPKYSTACNVNSDLPPILAVCCACVSKSVCACEREREKARECVCVCLDELEIERERRTERER